MLVHLKIVHNTFNLVHLTLLFSTFYNIFHVGLEEEAIVVMITVGEEVR